VSRFFPSTSDISYPLSNLTPETKYYFRLVVLDPEMGVLYGETKNFTTPVVHVSLLGSALGLNTTAANGKTNATTQTTTNNSSASQGETNARQGTNSSSARSSLFAGLFGLGSTNNTTNSTNITSTEGVGSLLPISFLGWTALALLIFFITALLVYIANLYRRLKEVKKKRKEERKAVPANLPIM
jgi:preprotein translocase subunit SecG